MLGVALVECVAPVSARGAPSGDLDKLEHVIRQNELSRRRVDAVSYAYRYSLKTVVGEDRKPFADEIKGRVVRKGELRFAEIEKTVRIVDAVTEEQTTERRPPAFRDQRRV